MTRHGEWLAPAADTHGLGASSARRNTRCSHRPLCPAAQAHDRTAAHVLSSHPEQGWSLLCNGVIVFDDTGELLPDGRAVEAHRPGELVAA